MSKLPPDPLARALARPLDRRRLLKAGAALAVAGVPYGALGQVSQPDVIVIGAGAAGIAAARKLAEAGIGYALIEAAQRVGGRTYTDTAVFGVAFDMGANRLHFPGATALPGLGRAAGFDIARAPEAGRLYLGGKEASDPDYEDFVGAVRRAERAIVAAGDAGRDLPAARVVPDLGAWSASAQFVAGPFLRAKDLAQVSTVDVAHAEDRGVDEICRQGLGALVASLAAPLAVQLDTAARSIELGGRRVVVSTGRGNLTARYVIVAVPPSVIAAGKLRIALLPARARAAVERITLGTYDHIAFEWPGAPGALGPGEIIHFRTEGGHGYALQARLAGTSLFSLEVGGQFAEDLEEAQPAAVRAVLVEAITREFGADAARRIGRVHHTQWGKAPFALGSMSCATPGAGALRRAFLEVVAGRLVFAGEHAHESLWGTVSGAWQSGERAAAQVVALMNGAKQG
ncbi:FAD-dependent oxidoreductase [Xanthobacter sp. V4C-4]|uniref:flavin monoamine oxidase family protein n=1 Tax=Xanthobacter cornucopiae TaxID=3119924 RepID=UPI00372A31E8